MPQRCPWSTSRVMLRTDWVSNSPPMKTWTATAQALIRTASSMLTASCSSDSSRRMLGPPLARSTMGVPDAAGIVDRTMPRVVISASAWASSGTIDRSTRSRPVVGPWKYPWSMASITVRPSEGRNTRARRFCMPQSSPADPFRPNGSARAGTDVANLSCPVISCSVIGASFGDARRPPQRVEQAFLGQVEHPPVDLPPGGVAVVVGGHRGRVRLEGRRALAQLALEVGQAGVQPGAPARAQGGAERAALGHRGHADRQAEHVRDDLRPEPALGRAAGEGQLRDRRAGQLADDAEVTTDHVGGGLLDGPDAGRAPGSGRVG